MLRKRLGKTVAILFGAASVAVVVAIATIPSVAARFDFWWNHGRVASAFPGVRCYEDRDGIVWHLIPPSVLTDPSDGRAANEYYQTGPLVQLYSVRKPAIVFVSNELFHPRRIDAPDWTNGVWIDQNHNRVATMLSAPTFDQTMEGIEQQLEAHGVSLEPLVTWDGTKAVRVLYSKPLSGVTRF